MSTQSQQTGVSPAAPGEGIRVDDSGIAWILGTNTKVTEVVLDHVACGWSSEEIHDHYPGLSPVKIKAALAYYREHQAEVDAEIDRRYAVVEEMRTQATGQFTRRELEARLRERHQYGICRCDLLGEVQR